MRIIKVTVENAYLHNLKEEFYCIDVDMSDFEEVEMAAEECCGEYLDMHADAINATCPDVSFEEVAEACSYIIEEVSPNEF